MQRFLVDASYRLRDVERSAFGDVLLWRFPSRPLFLGLIRENLLSPFSRYLAVRVSPGCRRQSVLLPLFIVF
jgi:hypothetical protein